MAKLQVRDGGDDRGAVVLIEVGDGPVRVELRLRTEEEARALVDAGREALRMLRESGKVLAWAGQEVQQAAEAAEMDDRRFYERRRGPSGLVEWVTCERRHKVRRS